MLKLILLLAVFVAFLSYTLVTGLTMIVDLPRWKRSRFFIRGPLDNMNLDDPGDRFQLRVFGVLHCTFVVAVLIDVVRRVIE